MSQKLALVLLASVIVLWWVLVAIGGNALPDWFHVVGSLLAIGGAITGTIVVRRNHIHQ